MQTQVNRINNYKKVIKIRRINKYNKKWQNDSKRVERRKRANLKDTLNECDTSEKQLSSSKW